jgi:hypothetical protein
MQCHFDDWPLCSATGSLLSKHLLGLVWRCRAALLAATQSHSLQSHSQLLPPFLF